MPIVLFFKEIQETFKIITKKNRGQFTGKTIFQ